MNEQEIQQGPDGHMWLFIQRQKSGTSAAIPLLPVSLDLLNKYKGRAQQANARTVFPVYSNQKMNQYLKEITKLAKIKKFVSYHVARHSFATSVTLNNDVLIESVCRIMGHKTLKQTQHYAKVLNKKNSEDMQALRVRLQKTMTAVA